MTTPTQIQSNGRIDRMMKHNDDDDDDTRRDPLELFLSLSVSITLWVGRRASTLWRLTDHHSVCLACAPRVDHEKAHR